MQQHVSLAGLVIVALALGSGCSALSTAAADNGLTITTEADFSSSAVPSESLPAKAATATCADLDSNPTSDDPSLADDLDCDGDGGLVTHLTPSKYSVAFKKLVLRGSTSATADLNIIADTDTLANAQVVTFTTSDTSDTLLDVIQANLTTGTYAGMEAEIYYLQMTFPVAGVTRNVRIYLSDDDFAAEGSLGHHQGDITFVDNAGVELGWIDGNWTDTTTTRSSAQNGDGDTDDETGHARGFFGNAAFWDAAAFDQGATQDIFTTTVDFDSALEVPTTPLFQMIVTLTFSVADTFYYEDFSPQNTTDFPGFYPATGGEATSATTEWAPILPAMDLTLALE